MNYTLINVLISVCILHIGIKIITNLITVIKGIYNIFPSSDLPESSLEDEEPVIENIDELEDDDLDVLFEPRYDVEAFNARIRAMKDEDGIFDIPVDKSPLEAGTEVIAGQLEMELDKYYE